MMTLYMKKIVEEPFSPEMNVALLCVTTSSPRDEYARSESENEEGDRIPAGDKHVTMLVLWIDATDSNTSSLLEMSLKMHAK